MFDMKLLKTSTKHKIMTKIFSLIIVFLTFSGLYSKTYAQTKAGKISGQVVDGSQKTVEAATISLLNAKDSSIVKYSVANKAGQYSFENIPAGEYIVSISALGHNKGF